MTSSRGSQAGSRARNLCAALGALLAFAAPLGGEDPKDLYDRAEQARKTGKIRLARVLFRQLLEQAPHRVDGHVGYQKLLQSQGRERDLVVEYEKLLKSPAHGPSGNGGRRSRDVCRGGGAGYHRDP